MSKVYTEIDFFQMEKLSKASSKPSSPEPAPSSFQGIQSVVSRINPQLLKAVMVSGAVGRERSADNIAAWARSSNTPSQSRATSPPPLPACNTPESRCSSRPAADTGPVTIFYNGTVATFDLTRDKAEAIMRMADEWAVGNPAEAKENSLLDGDRRGGDLPMARRKSLQSFLEKRRERIAWSSPYHKKLIPSRRPC